MQNFIRLWQESGIHQIEWGTFTMMLVGLLLLFLAVRKGFEPLLLVPIGFGCIMANIPGAGLAMSAAQQALDVGGAELLRSMAGVLGAGANASADELLELYKNASAAEMAAAHRVALDFGYNNGVL